MPLFTKENAAEMGRKGARIAKENYDAAKAAEAAEKERLAQTPASADEEKRRKRIQLQLDRIDELLDDADSVSDVSKLVQAKERLWNLLFPKAGVLRPRDRERRRSMPTATFSTSQPACGVENPPSE